MNKLMSTVALLALTTSGAIAGGIERTAPSTGILFEDGEYAEFSFANISPTVSGTRNPALGAPASTGDITPSYNTWNFGYKRDLSDNLSLALIVDQPYGASVEYPIGTGYNFAGSTATLDTFQISTMLRYQLQNNVSLIGGVRLQSMGGNIALSSGYTLDVTDNWELGYALGVAWEKPEIAMRVALTYYSAITHSYLDAAGGPFGAADIFEVETPQSVNLEFQTGIAQDTLLFGSIRWADWSETQIAPDLGTPLSGALVSYDDDSISYSLGLGRRFNENWSGAVILGHESKAGGFSGNLGPTDGYNSIGVAATWTDGRVKLTGGIRYIDIGDATTQAPAPAGSPVGTETGVALGEFTDNHAVAVGFKMSVNF